MLNRRGFLKTLAAAATVTIAGTKSAPKVLGANEAIRVAIIGLGRQGHAHLGRYLDLKDQGVRVTCFVEPDADRVFKALRGGKGEKPRGPLGDKSAMDVLKEAGGTAKHLKFYKDAFEHCDAVSIATPNHWHAIIAIDALLAGKHAYVEKPCSHNVHEGEVLAQVAKKSGKVVQHGTRGRGTTGCGHLMALLKSEQLGKLKVARGLCYKPRVSLGFEPITPAPESLAFDIWRGPAPLQDHHTNLVPYNWHYFWDFGNGEIGNQGVHQMDVARWGVTQVGGPEVPKSVIALGGRFYGDPKLRDQAQTPNTLLALFDNGPKQPELIFEVRGLQSDGYVSFPSKDFDEKDRLVGNVFHMENGDMLAGRVNYMRFGKDRKADKLPEVKASFERGSESATYSNFIEAIKANKPDMAYAPIREGHLSSALCHLANISYRLGEDVSFDTKPELSEAGSEAFQKMKAHLKANGVDLTKEKFRLGKKLPVDSSLTFKDKAAQALAVGTYRDPYVLPKV